MSFSVGGSFASALHNPLSREAGEGDTGGEGKRPRLTACMRWEKSPLPQRLLAEPLYPYQERAGSGGILHAQQFVNFARAIGITRFPLRAGGTERVRGSVSLAKRGEPKGGGQM